MQNTDVALMQKTMDIVAEKGLDGFSMKQVTDRLGLSEALLYKYFSTKENLLYQCFMSVNKQIAGLFVGMELPQGDIAAVGEFVHRQWEQYFRFMVNNGSRSLFYYAYRESTYLQKVLMCNNAEVAQDMQPFMQIMKGIAGEVGLKAEVSTDYIWLYLLEGTGNFVKYIIRNNMRLEDVDIDGIWKLLSGGLMGLL